jgi:hypothetical protein
VGYDRADGLRVWDADDSAKRADVFQLNLSHLPLGDVVVAEEGCRR